MHAYYFAKIYLITLSFSEKGRPFPRNKKRTPEEKSLKLSGDEWARTTDSRIFRPMLYQLSYITSKRGCKSR